jgi:hypothetical protein
MTINSMAIHVSELTLQPLDLYNGMLGPLDLPETGIGQLTHIPTIIMQHQ